MNALPTKILVLGQGANRYILQSDRRENGAKLITYWTLNCALGANVSSR
jgi:hypothetical protein